ncbi:hypothetical protein CIRG_00959 [Coccidioides immitis RMSCC 2394]|uniref:Uncharacterized protein n=1 Tax=Coccidioides immitis RMSCC 2394 TaxID=404692 RepID=A0A0J7AU40_COCIT|nr:hypothetical protein CIRG_00959 [Coccidioides immitis RMSCC 2394]
MRPPAAGDPSGRGKLAGEQWMNGTLAWPDCAGKKITTSSSSSSSSFPSTIRILQLKRSLLENLPVNCFICCKGAQSAAFHDPSPVAAPVTSPSPTTPTTPTTTTTATTAGFDVNLNAD